jgi:cystathionine gamma-lyase
MADWGPGTRAVHGGLPEPAELEPFLAGPVLAGPVHLAGDADPSGYGRFANPTWERYEAALAGLEGGETIVFSSGMAAISGALLSLTAPGDVIVVPGDGYPGVKTIATEHLRQRGVEVRVVDTDEDEIRAAMPGAALVWIETPSNPGLRVLDIASLAEQTRAAGALLAVDNTLATPLLQRPLELGADVSLASGTKALSGHSDVIIGYVAARNPALAEKVRAWRTLHGSIPGPFETWLAHRSLATLGVRVERQQTTAAALADLVGSRSDVTDVRYPGFGPVVCFQLNDAARAQAFLAACGLVFEATSFGGVHTTAERRARWGTDAVADGFIRFSCGVEDTADVLADVAAALDQIA